MIFLGNDRDDCYYNKFNQYVEEKKTTVTVYVLESDTGKYASLVFPLR